MILVSQDGFKAFNMAYIRGYYICEGKLGNIPVTPSFPKNKENTEYVIWVDPNPNWENENFYSIGKFKNLKDAQKVFMKLTSITNPSAEGVIIIKKNDVDFLGKDSPVWRDLNADNKE